MFTVELIEGGIDDPELCAVYCKPFYKEHQPDIHLRHDNHLNGYAVSSHHY